MSTTEIAIVNQSDNRVTDAECVLIEKALNQRVPIFCDEWDFKTPTVKFYPQGTSPPSSSWILVMQNHPTVDKALAYHWDEGGSPDMFCFGGYILDCGGKVLSGPNSVAGAASHEVYELLRDKACTLWVEMPVQAPDGVWYARVAAEPCDPVQSLCDRVTVDGQEVDLSAYVLPAWEDPTAQRPYDSANILTRPGEIHEGGYAVFQHKDGTTQEVYGAKLPEHIKKLKTKHGRIQKRKNLLIVPSK